MGHGIADPKDRRADSGTGPHVVVRVETKQELHPENLELVGHPARGSRALLVEYAVGLWAGAEGSDGTHQARLLHLQLPTGVWASVSQRASELSCVGHVGK